jgi:hypothetical protein
MYGGISLVVYINGIAHELLTMVRSTSKDRRQPHDLPGNSKLAEASIPPGTEAVEGRGR